MRVLISFLLAIILSLLGGLGITGNTSNIAALENDIEIEATDGGYVFVRSLEADKFSKTKVFDDGVTITADGSATRSRSPFTYNGTPLSYAFANCSEITVENLKTGGKISVYFMLSNGGEATISFEKSAYKLTNDENYKICTFDIPSGNTTINITGSSKIYGIIIN